GGHGGGEEAADAAAPPRVPGGGSGGGRLPPVRGGVLHHGRGPRRLGRDGHQRRTGAATSRMVRTTRSGSSLIGTCPTPGSVTSSASGTRSTSSGRPQRSNGIVRSQPDQAVRAPPRCPGRVSARTAGGGGMDPGRGRE